MHIRSRFTLAQSTGLGYIALIAMLLSTHTLVAQTTITSAASGNWNATSTWSPAQVPTALDSVVVSSGKTVTVTANASCRALYFQGSGNANEVVQVNSGVILTISGSVQLNVPQTGTTSNTLAVGGGSVSAGSISITGGLNSKISQVTISTGTLTVSGNFTFSAGGTAAGQLLTFTGAGTMNIGGDLSTNGVVTAATGSTIGFNGTGAQTIPVYSYHHLAVNKSAGTATLAGAITLAKNLTITIGTLDDGGYQITGNATGAMTMGSGSVLILGSGASATSFPTNYTSITLDPASTVIYNASSTQAMFSNPGHHYGWLKHRHGRKTVSGALNVDGDLVLESGSTFAASNFTHTLKGNFSNDGTFSSDTSTIVFAGSSTQTISGSAAVAFKNITCSGSGAVSMGRAVQIDGDLALSSGSLDLGANTLTINGGVTTTSGTLNGGATSDIVVGGSGAAVTLPAATLNNLTVNRANGLTLGGDLVTNGNITLTTGTMTVGAKGLTIKKPILGTKNNLRADATSTIRIAGNASGIVLPSSITRLGTLSIDNAQGLGLEGPLAVDSALALNSGSIDNSTFGLTIAATAKVQPGGGSLSNPPTFSGPVDVTYSNSSPVTTGSEIPDDVTKLKNLTVAGTGKVTLNKHMTINGDLTLTSGSLEVGAHTLTLKGSVASAGGTLDADSTSSIVVTGNGSKITLPAVVTGKLKVDRSTGAALTGDVTVTDSLQLTSGDLEIGAHTLTLHGPISKPGGTIIGGSSSNLTISGSGSAIGVPAVDLGTLTVDRTSGMVMDGDVSVAALLDLKKGTLSTSTNLVTVGTGAGSPGSISRTAGGVKGKLKRWFGASTTSGTLFPLVGGPGSLDAKASFTGAPSAGGTLTIQFIESDPGASGLPLLDNGVTLDHTWEQGYWKVIAGDGLSDYTCTIAFSADMGVAMPDYQDVHCVVREVSSDSWGNRGGAVNGSVDGTVITVSRTGLTAFSEFAIASTPANILPVSLAGFTVAPADAGAQLSWTTLSEVNNYGFHVQRRSPSGTVFETLAGSFQQGHGTTLEQQRYSYVDATAGSSSWYYRLEQVDLNGTVHHSGEVLLGTTTDVTVKDVPSEFSLAQNYPNPFNPSTTIRFGLPQRSLVTLTVYDNLGREVARLLNGEEQEGYHEVMFDASGLASGVYYYRLAAGSFVQTHRFMLVR